MADKLHPQELSPAVLARARALGFAVDDRERLREQLDAIQEAAERFSATIAEILAPRVERVDDVIPGVWALLYPELRGKYEAAGSPHGSDDDGMWRWLREQTEARRAAEDRIPGRGVKGPTGRPSGRCRV